ncbi:MAG: sigma-70 family RNA polymerase sigma factor [Polyangiaceae bacterium]
MVALRRSHPTPVPASAPPNSGATVSFMGEAALVAGVRARNPAAVAELFDRFGSMVLRVLTRILGPDTDLADLHQDAFMVAITSLDELREPAALAGWMRSIAVNTARAALEKRARRRRWLIFLPEETLPEPEPEDTLARENAREALRATYAVLARMPVDERIAFALRYIDSMELTEAAEATGTALATFKRRLVRAEARFIALARRSNLLTDYIEGGSRWSRP